MSKPQVPFGNDFRKKYFAKLDPKVVNVNHGSFGMTPDPLFESYIRYLEEQNKFPEESIRYTDRDDYLKAVKMLADEKVLNCDYTNLALVENATIGVNIILRSFPFAKGDKIVITSTTYRACVNTVKFLKTRLGIEIVTIELNFPLTDKEILEKFEEAFEKEKPKLCLFDTVTSLPCVKLPFVQIAELCKKYDVLSLIDGAHGIGLVEFSLKDIKPDFFVTNLHKWYFVQRGCAILYVDPKHHTKVHPIPISFGYLDDDEVLETDELNKMRFINTFQYVGTTNRAAISTIPEAIRFRQEVCGGDQAIMKYCNDLCHQVIELFTKTVWPNTSYLTNEDESAVTSMVTIEVPLDQYAADDFDRDDLRRCLLYIEEQICSKHNTFIPFCIHNGKLFVRFSCQIYNEIKDYTFAAEVIQKVFKEFFDNKVYNELKSSTKSGAVFLAIDKLSIS